MRFAGTLALAATASAQALKGFNYGATHTDNSPMTQSDFQGLFQNAQNLPGVSGFASARLYTTIQAGTTSDITSAIPAAIATKTKLLLGLWASSGQTTITNEISALKAAVSKYGSSFTDLVVGISVGSEDLYRDSTLFTQSVAAGQAAPATGASPDTVSNYISQVKSAISGTGINAPVGHVDTWTAWVNSSVSAVVQASDFIGFDAYPYFQSTMANDISDAKSLFDSAYAQTKAAAGGKPVWVTETGWPVSGPVSNQAQPNTQNAKQYWDQVGCAELFGQINTFWYTLQDANPSTPSPSFGIVASGTTPLFDLSCSNVSSSAIPTGTSSLTVGSAASATNAGSPGVTGAGGLGSGSGSGPVTYTNSAGATIVTSMALANGTGAPTVGTPVAPSATAGISTGGAVANAGSFAGVLGAALAVAAAL